MNHQTTSVFAHIAGDVYRLRTYMRPQAIPGKPNKYTGGIVRGTGATTPESGFIQVFFKIENPEDWFLQSDSGRTGRAEIFQPAQCYDAARIVAKIRQELANAVPQADPRQGFFEAITLAELEKRGWLISESDYRRTYAWTRDSETQDRFLHDKQGGLQRRLPIGRE